MSTLSHDARALAEALSDDDHMIVWPIFSPEFAREESRGQISPSHAQAVRKAELLAVGRLVEELRGAGWELEVRTLPHASPSGEAILVHAVCLPDAHASSTAPAGD